MRRSFNTVHTIVVGLGAMGAAALYQLAKRGVNALGIDQYVPPHRHGSSHGDTRITRQAICEGPEYVPLVLRSNEIWRELEQRFHQELFNACGGLIIGDATGVSPMHGSQNVVSDSTRIAERFGIVHELLGASDLRKRFQQFRFSANELGYYEPGAGFLRPEACIEAQLVDAVAHGAHTITPVTYLGHESDGPHIKVRTSTDVFYAERLILTVGPWIGKVLPAHADSFKIHRQVLHWFRTEGRHDDFTPGTFPVFIRDFGHGEVVYGFPAIDGVEGGIKIAGETYARESAFDRFDRDVSEAEKHQMFELGSRAIPRLRRDCVRSVACPYTMTPDYGFIIDRLPDDERVIIASPCSGHGFKHSAAVGQILAELATDDQSTFDISSFSLKRLRAS